MSILLSGGAGFLGRHVVEYFLEHTKEDLVLIDSLTYAGNLNRITSLKNYDPLRVKFVYHNLRSPINKLVKGYIGDDVEYIYHLAANSSVEFTLLNPEITVMDNVMATVNMLEFARGCESLKEMDYFSTDEVYGPVPKPGDGFDEEAPHKPSNPYSAGKAAGECYAHAWRVTYGLPVYITNTMNIFGFDQHPEKYIPTVIRHCKNGTELPVYSSANGKVAGSRYWIFAYDVADALLFLRDKAKPGEKYHIVGNWMDNLELAKLIAKKMGKPLKYKMFDFHSSRPGHDLHYGLTDTKLGKMGWKLRYGINEGLEAILHGSL
jgi:dTDP-glucose 4,6-dehydratase